MKKWFQRLLKVNLFELFILLPFYIIVTILERGVQKKNQKEGATNVRL